jgi:hypothetical protein
MDKRDPPKNPRRSEPTDVLDKPLASEREKLKALFPLPEPVRGKRTRSHLKPPFTHEDHAGHEDKQ